MRPAESTSHKTPVTKSEIAAEVALRMDPYLRGCTFRPVFTEGPWVLGCQFRSLLDACYFRLMLDMTEKAGVIRRCAYKKCNRFFFAPPGQDYCCAQHRVRASVDRCADRQTNAWLRELRKEGRIDKDLHDAARKEVARLYRKGNRVDGIKDTDALRKRIKLFLDQHRSTEPGDRL